MNEWDPYKGERIGPAWDRILELLDDHEWHSWQSVMDHAMAESGLKPKTVENLIYNGIAYGPLKRKGQFCRQAGDKRMVRLP